MTSFRTKGKVLPMHCALCSSYQPLQATELSLFKKVSWTLEAGSAFTLQNEDEEVRGRECK